MADQTLRRVAVVGGVRIPFCRSNTLYVDLSNLDMMTAALNGLTDRFGLAGALVEAGSLMPSVTLSLPDDLLPK